MNGPDELHAGNVVEGASDAEEAGANPEPNPSSNLAWLFGLQRFGVRTGLETVRELLRRLGAPELELDSVLVGGTNGKGSVARLLAACLQASGARTGLFTSPHLQQVGERAQVNGVAATEADMERLVGAVRAEATAVEATFFEVITAVCLLRFVEARADVAVLEVGMGGRLDATNVASPDLTIITGVALDHTAVLGGTLTAIAAEKAGILRRSVPVVTGASGAALEVLEARAQELGSPISVLGRDFRVETLSSTWDGLELLLSWEATTARHAPQGLREPGSLQLSSPLVGQHQAANVAQAAFGALLLGAGTEAVRSAIAATAWPGRLERQQYLGRNVVLDGAHNAEAATALARAIHAQEGSVAVLIAGISADKDIPSILTELAGVARHVLFTTALNSPRSAGPDVLVREWKSVGADAPAEAFVDPAEALQRAISLCPEGGTIVVAGSLFLVAEVSNLLDGVEGEPYDRWQ